MIPFQLFSSSLSAESYFTLAHCADQTHAGDCKAEQGYTCMDLVDTDRWLQLVHCIAYNTILVYIRLVKELCAEGGIIVFV